MTEASTRRAGAPAPAPGPSTLGARVRGVVTGHVPLVLLLAGVLGQALLLVHLVRTSWFGSDDVNFLTTRGPVAGHDLGLWRPYAGHWSTVPVLLYRALFAVFGLHSYLPYVGVVVVVHLACVVALYALLRVTDARPWPAALACWLLLWFGAGAEAFMVASAMNHTVPVLLSLLAALVVVRADGSDRGLQVGAALGVVIVMCSATGLTALCLLVGLVGVRYGVRPAARVAWPGVLAFLVWFLLVGRFGGRGSPGAADVRQVPDFMWQGLTSATGGGLGVTRGGGVLVCAAVVVAVLRRLGPGGLRRSASVGAVVAVLQLTLVTVGDAPLGSGIAASGRYVYVVLLLLTPGVALVLQVLADRGRRLLHGRTRAVRRSVAGMVVVAVVVGLAAYTRLGATRESEQAEADRGSAGVYRSWVYGSIAAADAGERQLSFEWGLLGGPFELFASPELRTRLPPPPAADGRLAAEAQWFVSVGTTDPGLFRPTRPTLEGLTGPGFARPGCHDVARTGTGSAIIDVPSAAGAEIGVTGDLTEVRTQLFRRYTPSPTRTWPVARGSVYVATSAKQTILRVVLEGDGPFTVCHR